MALVIIPSGPVQTVYPFTNLFLLLIEAHIDRLIHPPDDATGDGIPFWREFSLPAGAPPDREII